MFTHPPKVIHPQYQIPRIRKGVHHQKAVGEHSPDVREVEDDVPIRFGGIRERHVRVDPGDRREDASRVALVKRSVQTAG